MPISIVVGGQFGSEGKGKIALEIVRRNRNCVAAIRVGGTNSGHTAVDRSGRTRVLRQLPAAAIDGGIKAVLPPGAYIDPEIFVREVADLGIGPSEVLVSPLARVITSEHRDWEAGGELGVAIGSTQSGTGGSVLGAIARQAIKFPVGGAFAKDVPSLKPFLCDTSEVLRRYLADRKRIVVEGTQGFGLSILHGSHWPNATSRDTTAAGFLSEAGLSPLDVDDVTMVIRSYPIRVAGNSGPLPGETSWEAIVESSGMPTGHHELTTVTRKIRRIGIFDENVVRRAIIVNAPSRIVLNHLDYIDWDVRSGEISDKVRSFVDDIQNQIDRQIDWLGIGPASVVEAHEHAATPLRVAGNQRRSAANSD
jgi:adenylosuccinate synthase